MKRSPFTTTNGVAEEPPLRRAPDPAGRSEDLFLERPGDRDAAVSLAHGRAKRLGEMVGVQDDRSVPCESRWSRRRKRIGPPRSGRSGFGVVSVAGRKRVPNPAAEDERDHVGKTMSCGRRGIRLARLHPERRVGLGNEGSFRDAQLRREGPDGLLASPSTSAKRPSGVSSTTTSGRAASAKAPRRPALLVAEAGHVAELGEERLDPVRVVDPGLQLEARLHAPSRTPPSP